MSALILAAALAASAPADRPPQLGCRDLRPIQVRERRPPGRARNALKLGEQPPADLYRAVLRKTEGCDVVEVFVDGAWKKLPAGPLPEARPANKGW